MRMPLSNARNSRTRILLGTCAVALTLFSVPARAMDDGDDNLVHELTSLLGVDGDKKPDIDYRDRAPLVLPPKAKTGLPKPQIANERPNPAWPNDPDVLRAKKDAAEAKLPNLFDPHKPLEGQDRTARLASRVAPSQDQLPKPETSDCNIKHCALTQEQIATLDKSMDGLTSEKKYAVGEEPPREWLTEPPKGYRKVTKNADAIQPNAVAQTDSNPLMFWKRWFNHDQ